MGRDTDFNPREFSSKGSVPSYKAACMGMMVCPHCARSVICGDLEFWPEHEFHTPTKEELKQMDISKHRNKDRKDGFVRRDFLSVDDIPVKDGLHASVIEFREAPEGMPYSDFLLDIATGKGKTAKEYTVGLKSESVLLDMLIDTLGPKTEKYKGKALHFVRGGKQGKYINLD
jgi:hypothetical protein